MIKKGLLIAITLLCTYSIQAQNFLLYGMTYGGGTGLGYGTLFSFDPSINKDSVRIAFNSTDGSGPEYNNNIVLGYDNSLYSSTTFGGPGNYGILYKYNPVTGKDSILFQVFTSYNGQSPMGMIQATDSMFYGTTEYATGGNEGGMFRYNPKNGNYKVLFQFNITDGATPLNHPIQASDGLLYGLVVAGGSKNNGVLYRYNIATAVDTVLLYFNGTNGSAPRGTLMQASNGLLYGLTANGGTKNYGVLFSFDPVTYKDSVLWNFDTAGGFPANPDGGVIQATNGLLYGLSAAGGKYHTGTIFSYDIATGTLKVLESLSVTTGKSPYGDLVQAPDGLLYGLTASGGANNGGTLFSYDPVSGKDSVRFNFSFSSGAGPWGTLLVVPKGVISSVNEVANYRNEGARIYPNPFNKNTTICFNEAGQHRLEIDDITGRKLYSFVTGSRQFNISADKLSKGIYFIRVFAKNESRCSAYKIVVN